MDYEKVAPRIKELANNPNEMNQMLDNNTMSVQEHLPNVTQGIRNNLTSSIMYLNSKLPGPKAVFPLSKEYIPSESQKAKFEKHYQAVTDPVSILDHVKNGTLTNEHLEALQTVHPELYEHMKNKMLQEIEAHVAQGLPNHVKNAVSRFMGVPLESSQTQKVRLANQIALNQSGQQQQAPQGKQKKQSTQTGLSKLSLGKRTATQTDIEERDDQK